MPGIDLSTVSGPDLRRLLKVAHSRHEGLLADQLEWEIAARRATGLAHAAPRFARSADDDGEAPDAHMAAHAAAPEAPSFAPAYEPSPGHEAQAPAARSRGVLLVTAGALAGSLISAAVFWGLGRMEAPRWPARPAAERPAPQPAMGPTAQAGALPQPMTAAADAAPAAAVAAAPVEVAKQARTPSRRAKMELAATAQRPARPPTLTEWLADPAPVQRVDPDEPIH